MIRDLPLLAILRVDKLLLHEKHDQQRTPALIEKLEASGVLSNPPIITPLHDRTGRYMVLDGAHRTLGMKRLGIPHILAQIVEPDDPGLDVSPWNHVIWELDSDQFLESIDSIPNLELRMRDLKTGLQEMLNKLAVALIRAPNGDTYALYPPTADLGTRVNMLHAIVDKYKDQGKMDRTNLRDMEKLKDLYPTLTSLVVLPKFRIEEILYLAGTGHILPTGSTRFTISPRALHVNYPLEELAADKSLEEKDAALDRWLHDKIDHKSVRYYEEATFLFDE
ncbi:MAG TPA: ParB N-terminal domain-containing protein [Anaerolineales bacterium]|jgi:hypothetical protein|nr:ParB N-terminal domain-containing protein [Anaerolineales bacterium]